MKKRICLKILVIIVLSISILIVIKKITMEKRAGEYAKYENWKTSKVSKMLDYCDMSADKIDKIKLHFSAESDKEMGKYYIIKDKEVIDEIMEKINGIKVYGAKDSISEVETEVKRCSLSLYQGDLEYCVVMSIDRIKENEDVEYIWMHSQYKDFNCTLGDYPDPCDCYWAQYALIYEQGLIDYMYKIREENIKDITVNDIIEIYKSGDNELFFSYEIHRREERPDYDFLTDEVLSHIYTFNIEDFDGYILLEKENSAVDDENGTTLYTDIIDICVYKDTGEKIDFIECTEKELVEFFE